MSESPIEQLLAAVDERDVEATMMLVAPDCRMLTVDGRRAEGDAEVRELLSEYVASLRSASHTITAQWHQDDVWIAEVEATYELEDFSKIGLLPRAFVLREGAHGIAELHVYGAHERPLSDRPSGEEGMRLGGRWIAPL